MEARATEVETLMTPLPVLAELELLDTLRCDREASASTERSKAEPNNSVLLDVFVTVRLDMRTSLFTLSATIPAGPPLQMLPDRVAAWTIRPEIPER
jgi:hypothetical protein